MPKLKHSIEGNGGRAGIIEVWHTEQLLSGVLSKDKPKSLPSQFCANPRCRKTFRPRADGDIYCSEACDLDNNPQYRASGFHQNDFRSD